MNDLCCLNSCRKEKLSYHIIIKSKYYAKDIVEAGNFAKYVSKKILQSAMYQKALEVNPDPKKVIDYSQLCVSDSMTIVDTGVYGKNQLMRMINQSKAQTKEGSCPSGTLILMQNAHRKISDTLITFFETKDKIMIDETKRKEKPILTLTIKPKTKEKELEQIKVKMVKGDRFLSDDMITKTGKCLKE